MNQQISPSSDNEKAQTPLERERFALERAQAEFQQELERDRFEFEKSKASVDQRRLDLEAEKAKLERRLLNKHLGTVITAIVSLAAVLVTVAQVVTAIISKDKELQMMQAQKKEEMAMLQQQHQNEIQLLMKRQDQEWNLSTAKFFAENDRKIFSRDQRQRDSMLRVMILTFPASVIEAISQKDPQIAASINRARKASQETTTTSTFATTNDPFGRQVRWKPTGDNRLAFLDNWDKENIVSVAIPQLKGVPGFPSGGSVRFHKDAAADLKAAFAEIESKNLGHAVKTWDHSYAPITIRGSTKRLSKHALGVAFDINVSFNPRLRTPLPAGSEGSVLDLVPIFEKHGFKWGGTREPYHFEYATTEGTTKSTASQAP